VRPTGAVKENSAPTGLEPRTLSHIFKFPKPRLRTIVPVCRNAIDRKIAPLDADIAWVFGEHGTTLCDIVGIGQTGAATIIAIIGDPARFPTKPSFASFAGTAPIAASSGAPTPPTRCGLRSPGRNTPKQTKGQLRNRAAGVRQEPEPPSPSYRTRVPNLSPTYRSHRVKHVPGQHSHRPVDVEKRPILLATADNGTFLRTSR
jgi:hypothetical protein